MGISPLGNFDSGQQRLRFSTALCSVSSPRLDGWLKGVGL